MSVISGRIPSIRQGEDLEFVFDLDGEDISDWICLMEVKQFIDDTAIISRLIPPVGRTWPGFLTSTETATLPISGRLPLYITGKLTNSTTNQERQVPKRFHVGPAWA